MQSKFTLSSLQFSLIIAFLVTCLNFKSFVYVYENLSTQPLLFTLLLVVAYLSLAYVIFALLFVRYLAKFFAIVAISISFVSLYFNYSYGVVIDSDMIRNAMQTDTKEVLELLNWKFFAMLLCVVGLGIWIARIKIEYPPLKRQIYTKGVSVVAALVLFAGSFLPFMETYVPFFRTHNHIRMYNTPFYQVYALFRYYQKDALAKREFKVLTKEASLKDSKQRLLVLVVGETARAENYSLGGYARNDTNFYTKQEGVVYFSEVSSCGTSTAISLPCMFSFSKRTEYSSSEYQQNALDVLSLAMSAGGGGHFMA